MDFPDPLMVAENSALLVPTLHVMETLPPLTVPDTSSQSPGTGP